MIEAPAERRETAPAFPRRYAPGLPRTVSAAETLASLTPRLGEFGITRVANITGLDRIGIPVVSVVRPLSRSVIVSLGKGLDPDAAKVSGIMESIELFHAERIERPLLHGSVRELSRSHSFAPLDTLPRSRRSRFHHDLPLLWIEGEDVEACAPVWVPYESVHTRFVHPLPEGSGCFLASSNGLASGNVRDEAVLHAACELIERDARALWWQRDASERARDEVDPRATGDADCDALADAVTAAGFTVRLFDLTTDVGVPVYLCHIRGTAADDPFGGVSGAGCHASRRVAARRAITEAAQVRLALISGARDDVHPREYGDRRDDKRSLFAAPVVLPPPPADDDGAGLNLDADLALVRERLRAAGLAQFIVVDLGKGHPGIDVVRVLIPGLEGMSASADYVPGPRLRARGRP